MPQNTANASAGASWHFPPDDIKYPKKFSEFRIEELDRIDNVYWPWRPFVVLFWLLWGATIYAGHFILSRTCRFDLKGKEHLATSPNFIYAGWHESLMPFVLTFRSRVPHDHVQPIKYGLYYKPLSFVGERLKVRALIPVKPSSVRTVLYQVISFLKHGYSTVMLTDGPSGPARVLRRGVLHMAAESGVPILPMRTKVQPAWEWWWSWDKKRVPLPFSRIEVEYFEPLYVTRDNFEECARILSERLG